MSRAEPYVWIALGIGMLIITAEHGSVILTAVIGCVVLLWMWVAFLHWRRGS